MDYIKKIECWDVHGHFHFSQKFAPQLNILFGDNASGKTTLLHILVNALSGNFPRFAFIDFSTIVIELNSHLIRITRSKINKSIEYPDEETDSTIIVDIDEGTEFIRYSVSEIFQDDSYSKPTIQMMDLDSESDISKQNIIPIAYYPAFRMISDVWSVMSSTQYMQKEIIRFTNAGVSNLIRRWLTPFVPNLEFPSLLEIEDYLRNFSNHDDQGLIDNYLSTINRFFIGKQVILNREANLNKLSIELIYTDGTRTNSLVALSSGERQILSMFFALILKHNDQVILIDEPELSLHIDWQRKLVKYLMEFLRDRQLIICTHSPIIGADYPECFHRIEFEQTGKRDKNDN